MAKKRKVPVPYDNEQCKELAELVEVLTHSGQKTLDTNQLKKLNDIWTTSDKFVEYIYKLIIHQLEKDHSEIRYSAFQLCTEIFRQSENFRNLVVDNLDDILLLTAETDLDFPLPQPQSTAVALKKLALTTLSEWNKEYGSTYKRIVLGFNYLQRVKKVDFNALQLQSDAERAREKEKERRLEAVNKERIKKVENEVNEFNNDITTAVKSLNSCLDLLLPKPEEFFISLEDNESIKETAANNEVQKNTTIDDDDDDDDSSDDEMDCEGEGRTSLREFGAVNIKHSVEINIKLDEVNCLKETAENEAVIENARDHVKLIRNSYLPRCKGWLQILTKASGNVSLLKRIMDLKMSMEQLLGKYERLNITKDAEDDCVSTDSELEEVKESEDGIQKQKNKTKYVKKQDDRSQWNILSNDENPNDPTTIHSSIATLHNKKSPTKTSKDKKPVSSTKKVTKVVDEPKPSTSKDVDYNECSTSTGVNDRKKKLLAIAPKLPFDIDLYHWEDDKLNPPTILPTSMDTNKFWSSASGESIMEVVVPEGSSALRTRVIEFAGEFTPVSRSCRAPLSNGKLCPRLDRYKCPFHGVIVPRDVTGKCVDPKDEQTKAAEEEKKVPEWQDPALLNDIKLATGIDLKIPEKKGKGKRKKEKKYPGLTDLKAKQNTARNRLEKKIFKKSAMKRVASTLDNIEHRRFRDKYGDQFHYMYDTA